MKRIKGKHPGTGLALGGCPKMAAVGKTGWHDGSDSAGGRGGPGGSLSCLPFPEAKSCKHFQEDGSTGSESWREKRPRSRSLKSSPETEQRHRRVWICRLTLWGQTARDRAKQPPSEGQMLAGEATAPDGLPLAPLRVFYGSSRVLGALQRLFLILTRGTFTPFFT